MDTLATRLTEVMAELNLTKNRELAAFCGVSEGLVAQWFSGQTRLGPKPLKALARTNFSLDWIIEGRLPKYRKSETRDLSASEADADQGIDDWMSPEMAEWISLRQDLGSEDIAEFTALIRTRQQRNRKLIEELENSLHQPRRERLKPTQVNSQKRPGNKKQSSQSS